MFDQIFDRLILIITNQCKDNFCSSANFVCSENIWVLKFFSELTLLTMILTMILIFILLIPASCFCRMNLLSIRNVCKMCEFDMLCIFLTEISRINKWNFTIREISESVLRFYGSTCMSQSLLMQATGKEWKLWEWNNVCVERNADWQILQFRHS